MRPSPPGSICTRMPPGAPKRLQRVAGPRSDRRHVLDVSGDRRRLPGPRPTHRGGPPRPAQLVEDVHAVSRRYRESLADVLREPLPDGAVVAGRAGDGVVHGQIVGGESARSRGVDRIVGEAHHHARPGRIRFAALHGDVPDPRLLPGGVGEGSGDEEADGDDARLSHRRLRRRESGWPLRERALARLRARAAGEVGQRLRRFRLAAVRAGASARSRSPATPCFT